MSTSDITLSGRASMTTSSAVRDLLNQAARPGMISLAGGLPDPTMFPVAELADITSRLLAEDGQRLLQYGPTEGLADCREALTEHFGFDSARNALITTGSQQGLELAIRTLVDPGDAVVVSDPNYLGFLQILHAYRATPVAIPSDGHGMQTEVLAERLALGLRPKACYVVPHFHNPSGSTLSRERRLQLAELSSRYGFVVLEDDPYRDLHFASRPEASGAAAGGLDLLPSDIEADPALTVRLRSASKSLVPGLRVAVVHGPPAVHRAMVMAKQSIDLHTGSLNQAVVCRALQADWYPAHLTRLRAGYRAKCALLMTELEDCFGGRLRLRRPGGGMFLWVDFGPTSSHAERGSQPDRRSDSCSEGYSQAGFDSGRWLAEALAAGVCFVPGQAFSVERDLRSWVRLSFATASEQELRSAVARLAASHGGQSEKLVADT